MDQPGARLGMRGGAAAQDRERREVVRIVAAVAEDVRTIIKRRIVEQRELDARSELPVEQRELRAAERERREPAREQQARRLETRMTRQRERDAVPELAQRLAEPCNDVRRLAASRVG